MGEKIKPRLTRLVMFSVKHHWLILAVTIGVLYLSGEAMVEPKAWLMLSRRTLFTVHSLTAKLLLVATSLLALEKLYLYLLRKKKI